MPVGVIGVVATRPQTTEREHARRADAWASVDCLVLGRLTIFGLASARRRDARSDWVVWISLLFVASSGRLPFDDRPDRSA